jgi:UDP-N-acetylmuramoyl-L-alanyl-D-glutamate--2,6-diaminopimelate ligase
MDKLCLKELLLGIPYESLTNEQLSQDIGELTMDSREVTRGGTLVALIGYDFDAREFIDDALEAGAGLVIAEAKYNDDFVEQYDSNSRVIWIDNLRENLSLLASNYFQHPSKNLKVFGVTGTNGKTSCSYLIAQTLQKMNFACYLMGTLGLGQGSKLVVNENTTADAITIQKTLRETLNKGIQFVSMEVSSHGIAQSRTAAVDYHTTVFTNLTHDHLDFHGDMKKYFAAKRQLFLRKNLENAVINIDDRWGRKLAKDEEIQAKKWFVTAEEPPQGYNLNQLVWAEDIEFSLKGIHAKVFTPWGTGELESPLIGEFNLSNLLLVITALGCVIKDIKPILKVLKHVKAAPGRMQKIHKKNLPLVVVDYAHTPDALEKALLALREHCVGNIWCIFGCGGNRDKAKRPLMARVAEKLSNKVIVTTDNPRTELSNDIYQDIVQGFKRPEKTIYIEDREEAIEKAIHDAGSEDAILIAGKGHEDYQVIGNKKISLSDIDVATAEIERRINE